MAANYQLSNASKWSLSAVLVSVPVLTVAGLFAMTDDGIVPHENSELVQQYADATEMYAIAAGNLATHFGMVEIKTLEEYHDGDLERYDGAVYVGTDHTTQVPEAIVDDVVNSEVEVLWVGENAAALATTDQDGGSFLEQYGWDPTVSEIIDSADVTEIAYDGQVLKQPSGQPCGWKTSTPNLTQNSSAR